MELYSGWTAQKFSKNSCWKSLMKMRRYLSKLSDVKIVMKFLIILLHCCNLYGNISRTILSDTTLCCCVLHCYDFIIRGHVSHTFLGGDILKYSSVSCGTLLY